MLLEKLKKYLQKFPKEEATANIISSFIQEHDDCFCRTNQKGHITASALIVDDEYNVLLMHHTKLKFWMQPGGHCDGDPNVLDVAMRESFEETGLNDLTPVDQDIFDIDCHEIPKIGQEPKHHHFDIRFLLKTNNPESIQKNHESNQLKWFNRDELNNLSLKESVMRMVKKLDSYK